VFPSVRPVTPEKPATHLREPKKGWERIRVRAELLGLIAALEVACRWAPAERDQRWRDAMAQHHKSLAELRALATENGIDPQAFTFSDLRIHDLRRTMGSWQAKTGASMAVIGKSLGHRSIQSTAVYSRLDNDPVRDAMETATTAMWSAGGLRQDAQVIPIGRARGKTAA
jgi:integrase